VAVEADVTVIGLCPPMTPRNPNGTVAKRETDPTKPFLLSTMMLLEFENPAVTVIEYGMAYAAKSA